MSPTKPTRFGGPQQFRGLVAEPQQLADPQPGTAAMNVTQEPLAAQLGGDGLVEGPAALVEPTDHAAHAAAHCASSTCIAPPWLETPMASMPAGSTALATCRMRRQRRPHDFLDVLFDSAVADMVQLDRAMKRAPAAGPRGRSPAP